MIDLKPCPFCGSSAEVEYVHPHKHNLPINMPDYPGGAFIECTGCTAAMSGDTVVEVVSAWNKREGRE